MRNSCNGCRVLRKGCDDKCVIRPCLQWIKSSDAQANATLFLAKFFGRAGLLNLITSETERLRPSIFRSLLYEACGRVVNPVYGATGLLWTGNWHLCEAAVESALQGEPISQIGIDDSLSVPAPPLKSSDIRHVSRESSEPSDKLHKVTKTRTRFKRSVQKAQLVGSVFVESGEQESEGSHVSQTEPDMDRMESGSHICEVGLDLTLRLGPSI